MTAHKNLVESIASMESALATTLNTLATSGGSLDRLESILRLIIKKEILLEMLLEEASSHK